MPFCLSHEDFEPSLGPSAVSARGGQYSVEVLPYHHGSGAGSQHFLAAGDGVVAGVLGQDPFIEIGDDVKVQRPPQRAFTVGRPRDDGHAAGLRKRGGLQSQPVATQIAHPVGAAASESERLSHPAGVEPPSIVGYVDRRARTGELDLHRHVGGAGRDAVIDQIGNRADEVVPDVAQRRCKPAADGEALVSFMAETLPVLSLCWA